MSVRPLSAELRKTTRNKDNESPRRIEEDLDHIRDWLSRQPHLPCNEDAYLDDQFILGFLRGCKYSLERTKEKLDLTYTLRGAIPEFFGNRDPLSPDLQQVIKYGNILPLLKLTPEGRRVFLMRLADKDPAKYFVDECFTVTTLITEVLVREDDSATLNGVEVVFDMDGYGLNHMVKLPLTMMKKQMICIQDANPLRIKAMHFMNAPPIVEKLTGFVKPLMKEKLRRRIYVHRLGSNESLYRHIPRKILPKEYDGHGASIQDHIDFWKNKLESYRDVFVDGESLKTDESKRPGRPRSATDLFGMEGSFRQLSLD